MTVDIGVIGCGAATDRYYVPLLKKFSKKIGNLYFVDTNIAQAQAVAQRVGKGKVYDNYRKIIDRVQGVIVAIPHFLHQRVSMEFLKAGVNVLCEKPLAEDPEQVKQIIAAAEDGKVALCVNNTRRMFPNFQKIREMISEGQIGQIKSIDYIEGSTFGWASATGFYVDPSVSSKGILLDLGSHVIDTICWWLGEKPKLVEYRDDSFGGPESVVRITAEIRTCRIRILLNRLCDLDSQYKIVGESGTIEGKPLEWGRVVQESARGKKMVYRLPVWAHNYPEFMVLVFKNFIDVITNEARPLVSGKDVQPSIEFIDECYRSRRRFVLASYDGFQRVGHPSEGRVLVAGASGFIGGRFAEFLHLTERFKVKAAINRWASAARIGRFPVDIVQMDLMNPAAIGNALEGVTDIVHCVKGSYEVTVEGTRNLLEAALKKGVRRFVHLSTTEVYGDVTGEVREDAPLQYTGNEYNRMKIDAEKVCWDYLQKGVPVTVLRPSIVYGPFSKNWTLHFARLMLDRKWGILDGIGEGNCNLVYVDDLIRAALLALDNETAVGEAFNIVGSDVLTWNKYFQMLNSELGLPPLKLIKSSRANFKTALMQPVRIAGGFARDHFMGTLKKIAETFEFADRVMRGTENMLKASPALDELKLFNKKAIFLSKKSIEILDFKPMISLTKGLSITSEWLKHQGILYLRYHV